MRMVWKTLIMVLMIMGRMENVNALCNRVPHTTEMKSVVDENYVVGVDGNPKTYLPGQSYTVSLSAYNGHSFIIFMLGLESQRIDLADITGLGYFELLDPTETRFSPRCEHMVENTNTNSKTQINVTWVAPVSGSGCIYLRATVVERRDVWYKDDGFLTKEMCEEEIDDVENQPTIVEPCCACDEAKYELTFEGKWSRHTHPKDFPANNWRTRFSDIIGASHTVDYRFWQYGELASKGLTEVAEHGSTKTLESELKAQSDEIRTIIKARGIAFPNVTGKTFAVFRVDSRHHLLSLVSMVQPSPDWIVGVSGLELCLANCTWIDHKVLNLYPWDAGTDSGPSYMSSDQPQIPDVIRRIKSNYPNDPRSPFFDPTGAPMKPLATLYINRRRLYEKTCESSTEDEENEDSECATHAWSEWSECSTRCGPGRQYRERDYRNSRLADFKQCSRKLRDEQRCVGQQCDDDDAVRENDNNGDNNVVDSDDNNNDNSRSPECAISEWGEWSACSSTCGEGVRIRSRHYLNKRAKKKCQKARRIRLQDSQRCDGIDCGGDIGNGITRDGNEENADDEGEDARNDDNDREERSFDFFKSYSQVRDDYIPPECGVSTWSDFSPCLGPCGALGQRQRIRHIWRLDELYGTVGRNTNTNPCAHIKHVETVNCTMPACDQIVPSLCYEQNVASPCRGLQQTNFWYYDHLSDQCGIFVSDKCDVNRNKFKTRESCEKTCQTPRHRQQQHQRQQRLEQQRRQSSGANSNATTTAATGDDCLVSKWREFPCNATCGHEGLQMRMRKVLRTPNVGGRSCPRHLLQYVRCYKHCSDGGAGNNYGHMTNSMKCHYSTWSQWTPCTLSCGHNSMRQRTRTLLNTEMAQKCTDRVEIAQCPIRPCPHNDHDNDNDN